MKHKKSFWVHQTLVPREHELVKCEMTRPQLSLEFIVASNLHSRLRKADFPKREKTDITSWFRTYAQGHLGGSAG